ncbi:hypothetical protein AN958_12598 [Leucoagaricus sp. SymC.cos]|nr:hypothetical protein AN958_12598 [Leucoagaricus sp. SymC.cos]
MSSKDDASTFFAFTLHSLTYGVVLCLYCLFVGTWYPSLRKPGQRRGMVITLVYSSLAMIGCTAFFVLMHYLAQTAFVYHRDYPAGPSAYGTNIIRVGRTYRAYLAVIAALDWLTAGVQIWRLHIIWNGAPYYPFVMGIPILLYLAYIGVGIVMFVLIDLSKTKQYYVGIAFFGIAPVMTLLVTSLICARLILIRRRLANIMDDTTVNKHYMGIIAMLVECYALDALWSLMTIIAYIAQPALFGVVFVLTAPYLQVVALFLITYRVAKGRAWQSRTERELTTLRWNHSVFSRTDQLTTGPFTSHTSNASPI